LRLWLYQLSMLHKIEECAGRCTHNEATKESIIPVRQTIHLTP
jgi:hypothetical protein